MTKINRSPKRWLQWAHEFLFSLNLAWIVVWAMRVTTPLLGGQFVGHYVSVFIRRIPLNPIGPGGGGVTVLEQFVWSLALAAIAFFLLRLIARFDTTRVVLRTIAGTLAIAVFPLVALYSPFAFFGPNHPSGASRIGLTLEVAGVLFVGILYYLGKNWFSYTFLISVMAAHFVLWAWLTSSYVSVYAIVRMVRDVPTVHSWSLDMWSSIIFRVGSPLIGLLASLTWASYVRCLSESRTPKLSTL
jgi:hypothetical protein